MIGDVTNLDVRDYEVKYQKKSQLHLNKLLNALLKLKDHNK